MKLELTQAEMVEAVAHWLNTVRFSLGYPVSVTKVSSKSDGAYPSSESFYVETSPQEKSVQ